MLCGPHACPLSRLDARRPGRYAATDRAILDAYRWREIPTNREFLLEYGTDEDEQRAKKGCAGVAIRYDVRRGARRVLELDAQRALQEEHADQGGGARRRSRSGDRQRARPRRPRLRVTRLDQPWEPRDD